MVTTQRAWFIDGSTIRLIRARAARIGLSGGDVEDVQQEILLHLSAFRPDPERIQGAKSTTVLVTIIDRRLRMWLRCRRRYQSRLTRIRETIEAERRSSGRSQPAYEERTGMFLDVRQSVATLEADDQRICRALGEGQTVDAIAADLGCSWHTVKRRVKQLRVRFEEMELHAWLRW